MNKLEEIIHTLIYSSLVYSGSLMKKSVMVPSVIHWTYSSKVFVTLKIVTTMSTALYPCPQSSFNFSIAPSTSLLMHARMIPWTITGCGWSQTLNTFSPDTNPKPECVDWRLLMACRISPSLVKMSAVKPSSLYSTCLSGGKYALPMEHRRPTLPSPSRISRASASVSRYPLA